MGASLYWLGWFASLKEKHCGEAKVATGVYEELNFKTKEAQPFTLRLIVFGIKPEFS